MKLTEVQRDEFRRHMRSALECSIQSELNFFLENVADYHFSDDDIENGSVRDCLYDEVELINIQFIDE